MVLRKLLNILFLGSLGLSTTIVSFEEKDNYVKFSNANLGTLFLLAPTPVNTIPQGTRISMIPKLLRISPHINMSEEAARKKNLPPGWNQKDDITPVLSSDNARILLKCKKTSNEEIFGIFFDNAAEYPKPWKVNEKAQRKMCRAIASRYLSFLEIWGTGK